MAGALSVALTWSLNETADGFYKISKDIVHAATTDGVQATALDALDKFGATLAICPDTEYQVEQELRKAQGSRVVDFMKSQIGFMAGDSCTALSKSIGGLRFLSLAATLVTMNHFEAAKATRQMMEASAKRNEILPTLGNLRAVYEALEYKSNRFGFSEKLVEWHGRIVNHLRRLLQDAADPFFLVHLETRLKLLEERERVDSYTYPDADFISRLVEALRETFRLGTGGIVRVSIRESCVWTIAFIHWCVGICPTVILLESGLVICEDPQLKSHVEVRIIDHKEKESIMIFTQLNGITSLWKSDSTDLKQNWTGMISVSLFGKECMQECDLDTGQGYQALGQALLYSTMAAMSKVQTLCPKTPESKRSVRKDGQEATSDLRLSTPSTSFFSKRISVKLAEYIGCQDFEEFRFERIGEGLSLVVLVANALAPAAIKQVESV
ncbi:hypothetical protein MMC10_005821 [Thelotrema lepadinum]|nr:hypothetical protein [Thelotrema lepadinum]